MPSRIAGTGRYLPAQVLTNEELAQRVDTSDEWITHAHRHPPASHRRGGRNDIGPGAARFARGAGSGRNCARRRRPHHRRHNDAGHGVPVDGVHPADKLGTKGGAAFDVQAVCSGFVYGLALADKMVGSGMARNALVVGAEIYSRILDWIGSRHVRAVR